MRVLRKVIPDGARRLARSGLDRAGYRIVRTDRLEFPRDLDHQTFRSHYEACRSYTMTSAERMYALSNAVRYVIESDVPGSFVECGVWRGGSSMLVARVLVELGVSDRPMYLYDTFAGMAEPSAEDGVGTWDRWAKDARDDHNEWCFAPLEEVQRAMASTGYPEDLVHYVAGKIEDTIPGEAPNEIALLRLDTDWYASTRHGLTHLYRRLAGRGILVIDDYGHWEGARRAVDEFFADHEPVMMHRVDKTGRVIQKPESTDERGAGAAPGSIVVTD